LSEELSFETVTVRAARAIAPVVVDRKPSDVSTVDVAHMLWDDSSQVRSPVTPGASGSHRFCSQLPATVAPEWVHVRDNVGKNIGDVPGLGSAREPSPPDIVEKLPIQLGEELSSQMETVRAARAIAPAAVEEKQVFVSGVVPTTVLVEPKLSPVFTQLVAREPLPTLPAIVEKQTKQFSEELGPQTAAVSAARKTVPVTVGEKHSFFSGSVAFLAKVCQKIMEVCGQGFARSHFQTPPDIVEKRTRPLAEELSFETVTVRAARARAPVVVDRKPDYVRNVEPMLSDVGSRARSPSDTPVGSGEKLSPSPLRPERATGATVSTVQSWVPVAAKQDNICGAVVPEVADVCGENLLSPMMPVMLSPSMMDAAWAGCGEAIFTEGMRQGLIWQCDRGGILTDIALRLSWKVSKSLMQPDVLPSWRPDEIGMGREGAIAYSPSPHTQTLMRRCVRDLLYLVKAMEQLRIAPEFVYSHGYVGLLACSTRDETIGDRPSGG